MAQHEGGKKERRSQEDKAKARRQKTGPVEGKKKTNDQKAVERALRKQRQEQGVPGMPGAGRGGPQESKKQKSKRPDRKQKHKGRGYQASDESIQRVASAYLNKQPAE